MCRVNAQLGGGSTAVHVDADASWKVGGNSDGSFSNGGGGSGGALTGWRVRVVQAFTIAAVAMCLWALVESILSTHGSAGKFWDVIDDAKRQVCAQCPHLRSAFACGWLVALRN